MSSYIDNALSDNAKIIEYQKRNKVKNTHKKNKHIVVEKEDNFYCTYIKYQDGQKILLKRVPISKGQDRKEASRGNEANELKKFDNLVGGADNANIECQQQILLENSHRKNIREIMEILKDTSEVQSKPKKSTIV